MASGNREYEKVSIQDGGPLDSGGELDRVKDYLREVMQKNQGLEEMLLYTTQELEKEKENSRKIVLTLTERLMESREMINKLEMENMRYRKDCILAVELLQCNRNVDQRQVSATVKKLTDNMDPAVNSTYTAGHTAKVSKNDHTDKTTKEELKNSQPSRQRTFSKHKSKSEGSNKSATALLTEKETHDAEGSVLKKLGGLPTHNSKALKETDSLVYHKVQEKDHSKQTLEMKNTTDQCNVPALLESNNEQTNEKSAEGIGNSSLKETDALLEYHRDLKENPCEKTSEMKTMMDSKDVPDSEQVNEKRVEEFNNKNSFPKETERLIEEKPEGKKTKIANDQQKSMDIQVDVKSIKLEGLNNEDSFPKTDCLTDEWSQEDNPLIGNGTGSSTQQSQSRGNVSSANIRDTEHGHDNVAQSSSLVSSIGEGDVMKKTKVIQEDSMENEKLLSLDEGRSDVTQNNLTTTSATKESESNFL